MHQFNQWPSLFCLILFVWLTFVKAQDSELYRQVLGWSTDSTTSCPNNCHGRGQCKETTCDCLCGYLGSDCAVNSCSDSAMTIFSESFKTINSDEAVAPHYTLKGPMPSGCECVGLVWPDSDRLETWRGVKEEDDCFTDTEGFRPPTQEEILFVNSDGNEKWYWTNLKKPIISNGKKSRMVRYGKYYHACVMTVRNEVFEKQ